MSKKLVAFQIDEETKKVVDELAKKEQRSFSSQIRFIIQEWITKNK